MNKTAQGIHAPFWKFEIGARAMGANQEIIYHHYGIDVAVRLTAAISKDGDKTGSAPGVRATANVSTAACENKADSLKVPQKLSLPHSTLYAFGDPQAGVAQLAYLAENFARPELVMIDRKIHAALPPQLQDFYGPYWGKGWDFFYSTKLIPNVAHTAQVVRLPAQSAVALAALPEIEKVLRSSIKSTQALSQMEKYSWFVHRLFDGKITAAMGVEEDHGVKPEDYMAQVGVDLGKIFQKIPQYGTREVRSVHFAGLGADQEFRGQGFGTAVMVAAVNWHLQNGYDFIRFGVWDWNERASKLYRRLGIASDGGVIFGQQSDNWD